MSLTAMWRPEKPARGSLSRIAAARRRPSSGLCIKAVALGRRSREGFSTKIDLRANGLGLLVPTVLTGNDLSDIKNYAPLVAKLRPAGPFCRATTATT